MAVLRNGKTNTDKIKNTENATEKIIWILKDRPYATAGQIAEELRITIDGVDYNIRKNKEEWCKFCVSFLGAVSKEKVSQ